MSYKHKQSNQLYNDTGADTLITLTLLKLRNRIMFLAAGGHPDPMPEHYHRGGSQSILPSLANKTLIHEVKLW